MAEGAGDASGGATGVPPGALTALLEEVAAAPEQREADAAPLAPGTVVGRFEIIRELGRGGFGVVYEARDRDLGRQVAIKVVRPGRITEEEGKVPREAEAIARLAHPNLITLHEVGRSEHGPFLVFELLRGRTLDLRIEEGPLPVQEAVHIATEVARGLAHAHAEGVIHRDLKPANVFVTNKGQVKILDFGMAHAFGRRRLSGGTPAYMAPEQWEDDPEDERTDVFALGVMLYRMLTGEYPFPEGQGRWSSEPAALRKLDVPGAPDLAELVEKMLERTPKARPRDGAAVLAALTSIEEKLRARPADGSPPVHAKRRKATFGDLLAELRRRHVFRVMIGYGVVAFAVLQVTEPIMHGADLPNWVLKAVLVALALGFPVAVILAWVYDLTAHGVKRTPSSTDPGAPRFGRSRLLLPLAVSAVVLAIGAAGAGGWYAWKWAGGQRPASPLPGDAPSIAVLPFADLSPNHDQEYLSDGIAEEILDGLARIDGLKVIGRTSSFSFKGKPDNLRSIGDKLGVTHLLEGSLRKVGSRFRISVKLVEAKGGSNVWSETFEREPADAFSLQAEVARAVATALRVKFGAAPPARRVNPEAYNEYLLGRQFARQGTPDGERRALQAYRNAMRLDPTFAAAQARVALAMTSEHVQSLESLPDFLALQQSAMAEADRAVALGPDVAEGYVARGIIRAYFLFDWDGAQADLQKAIQLGPETSASLDLEAFRYASLGKVPEAIGRYERAVELDPLSPVSWASLAWYRAIAGQRDRARTAIRRAQEIAPDSGHVRWTAARIELLEGNVPEALALFERVYRRRYRLIGSAQCLDRMGRTAEADVAIGELERDHSHLIAYELGIIHASRGDRDRAFEWLERAYRQRDGGLTELKIDPFLASLRDDPRYTALLRKMNLPVDGDRVSIRAAEATAPPSIAVLPFADMSPKHDQEYFADGVAEEILNGLARVDGLKVIGRTSSFSFKGKSDDLKMIGQKLGVANLLEGSLRKSGGRLRITAQLVKAADGVHLWSQTFDRPAADVFAVQEEIARAVVDALKVKLAGSRGIATPPWPTGSLEAHDQYLLGLGFVRRGLSGDAAHSAREAFARAIQADPSFAPAWAEQALVLWNLSNRSRDPAAIVAMREEAMAAADKAIFLGPSRPDGHRSRAFIRWAARLDWIGSRSDLEEAMRLNPGDARTLGQMGARRAATEGPAAGLPLLRRAVELDPLFGRAHESLCWAYAVQGSFDDALGACRRAIELSPDSERARAQLGEVLLLQGNAAKALEVFEKLTAEVLRAWGVALAQFSLGNVRASEEALAALASRSGHVAQVQIAEIHAWRGDKDRAFEWLDRALAERDGALMNTRFNPLLRNLRGDPRFTALLRRANLPAD